MFSISKFRCGVIINGLSVLHKSQNASRAYSPQIWQNTQFFPPDYLRGINKPERSCRTEYVHHRTIRPAAISFIQLCT